MAVASSTPVSVTGWAVAQSVGVKVNAAGNTVPSAVFELATSRTTAPVGSLARVTVKVAVPPDSVVRSGDAVGEVVGTVAVAGASTTPAVSSSVMVPVPVAVARVALAGLLNVTAMVSFASSRASPVRATASVRPVVPAAKVRVPAVMAV